MLTKNFVQFFWPGFIFSEEETVPIKSWYINEALKIIKNKNMKSIYGFRFLTRGREDDELDSRIIKQSGMYFLKGHVKSLKDIEDERNLKNRTLIGNMKCNGWTHAIIIDGMAYPFEEGDELLDVK